MQIFFFFSNRQRCEILLTNSQLKSSVLVSGFACGGQNGFTFQSCVFFCISFSISMDIKAAIIAQWERNLFFFFFSWKVGNFSAIVRPRKRNDCQTRLNGTFQKKCTSPCWHKDAQKGARKKNSSREIFPGRRLQSRPLQRPFNNLEIIKWINYID